MDKRTGVIITIFIIAVGIFAYAFGASISRGNYESTPTPATPTPAPATTTATPTPLPLLNRALTTKELLSSRKYLQVGDIIRVSGAVEKIAYDSGYFLSASDGEVIIEFRTIRDRQFNAVLVGDKITVEGEVGSSNPRMVVVKNAKLISRDPS